MDNIEIKEEIKQEDSNDRPEPMQDDESPDSTRAIGSPYSFTSSMDDDDIVDQLLERSVPPSNSPKYTERDVIALKKRGKDYFEVLPEGWKEMTHASGMPLYVHKKTKVCTLSKPYQIGDASARQHEIPVTAITCLQYKRELEKESQIKEGEKQSTGVRLVTVEDHKRHNWLSPEEVREYCDKLFQFETIRCKEFKEWADRRRHNAITKIQRQRPSLPDDTKFITCASALPNGRKEFIMNPAGKSNVCILHEFVQHKEKDQPKYIEEVFENAVTPFCATAVIGKVHYGVGYGRSKKEAKEEAAKKTLEILIPNIKDLVEANSSKAGINEAPKESDYFDNFKIDDNRIFKLCHQLGQPSPYQILVEYTKRNAGACEQEITSESRVVNHHLNIYTMRFDGNEASVKCKSSREGKQLAAQKLLQKLHPQINSWGGILSMYGRGSRKTPKEKKEEERKITVLQTSASPNKPNFAILSKLKEEMLKLNH